MGTHPIFESDFDCLTEEHTKMADDLEDRSPGAQYEIFVDNEQLMERLKLLDFETKFVAKGLRPISRVTFAIQNKENQGEQFTQFTRLVQFLLKQNGLELEVDEFDDPSQIVSQVMEHCRRLGTGNTDFPPQKLRPGYGAIVVGLLNALAQAALVKYRFGRPSYPNEQDEQLESGDVDDDDEQLAMGDDGVGDESDDDGDGFLHLGDETTEETGQNQVPQVADMAKVDPEVWREEVERITPQLKITLRADQKNWRQRVETLKQNREHIEQLFTGTEKKLTQMSTDIGGDLEKTSSREKYINQQLDGLINELRNSHDKLAKAKETYTSQTSGIAEKTTRLGEINQELEHLKNEMDERGQAISDGKPIQQAKRAITQLTKENQELDVRIAVIEHEITQKVLKMETAH